MAKNAKKRKRDRAYPDGEGGELPNCMSLSQLVSPMDLLSRPGGENFLLYDIGAGPERIATLGTQSGASCLCGPNVWGADGTFKAAPDLRAQLYTVHAVAGGYVPPCIFAPPPVKPGTRTEGCGGRSCCKSEARGNGLTC